MKNDIDIPQYLEDCFNNLEDILYAMDDHGLHDLEYDASQQQKLNKTPFGLTVQLRNRDGNYFTMMVMPNDITEDNFEGFRRQLVDESNELLEIFPHYKTRQKPVSARNNVIQFPTDINR